MKLAKEANRCGIEALEQEVEDIEETEKVFKEGLRLILYKADTVVVNEILSNMIAHEKCKYMRLYKTIQKRAVLGLQAGESTYILYKVLNSLAGLTVKESRKVDAWLFEDDDEPETDAQEDENEGELSPFDAAILSLDDSAITIILKEFDTNVLVNALIPSTEKVRNRFYNIMWHREAAMLKEDIEYMGKGGRIEDAQQMILTFLQNLADYVPSNNAPRDFDKVGKFTSPHGDVYEGDFLGSKFHGKGKYIWASGEVYEGDFADGKRNGKGKMTYPDGKVEEGNWVEDKLVQ
jgi:hypothetical protein